MAAPVGQLCAGSVASPSLELAHLYSLCSSRIDDAFEMNSMTNLRRVNALFFVLFDISPQ